MLINGTTVVNGYREVHTGNIEVSFKAHDFMDVTTWMSERRWICFAIAAFYIVTIFGIKEYLRANQHST